MHDNGLLLALASALFPADRVRRGTPGGFVNPAGEHDASWQHARFSGQVRENHLRHVFGQVGVAVELPESRRIYEVEMAADQFTKGCFIAIFCKASQLMCVLSHGLSIS